jgi:hypothetical protein
MHVMIHSPLYLILISIHGLSHGFPVDEEDKGEQKNDDDNGWQAVAPDVHAFIVKHKQALQYLFRSIKIDSISMSNVQVILHERRRCLIVPNIMVLFCSIFIHHFCRLLLSFLLLSWLLRRHCKNNKI